MVKRRMRVGCRGQFGNRQISKSNSKEETKSDPSSSQTGIGDEGLESNGSVMGKQIARN